MPELRIDPIVGRRVYVAEDRAGRPNSYVSESLPGSEIVRHGGLAHDTDCCFCAGYEDETPFASATVTDSNGYWQVRVVPNKYPAVRLDEPESAAFGVHEVIIESSAHVLDVTALGVEHLATILDVFRDRLRHWSTDRRLKHAVVFKNSGFDAGASLEHVHSQLVALPYVPDAVEAELAGAERFFQLNQRCVFCDLVEREMQSRERLVVRQHGFAAFCAYAGRQPLETWIVPEDHAARFDWADDGQLHRLAIVLHEVLRRLHAVLPGAAYNLVLHSGPFLSRSERATLSYHWHWELIPRVANLAGLELGAGIYINPLSPEHAAERLRGV